MIGKLAGIAALAAIAALVATGGDWAPYAVGFVVGLGSALFLGRWKKWRDATR